LGLCSIHKGMVKSEVQHRRVCSRSWIFGYRHNQKSGSDPLRLITVVMLPAVRRSRSLSHRSQSRAHCTAAGTTASSEPTWPLTQNGTVVDGWGALYRPRPVVFLQKNMASRVSLHRVSLHSGERRKNAELPLEALQLPLEVLQISVAGFVYLDGLGRFGRSCVDAFVSDVSPVSDRRF
jgi:hypothetical protein